MASRKPLRARGLPGQVAVIFVVAISCLLIAVGLGVDVSTAYSAKTGQEAVLEAVRQSSLGMSNAVKYSENPGREAREEVVELLSGNGYTGTAAIWYAELPESESGANDRYAGVYVRLSNDTETTFLKLAGRVRAAPPAPHEPRGHVRGRHRDRPQGDGGPARRRPGRAARRRARRGGGQGKPRQRGKRRLRRPAAVPEKGTKLHER